MDVSRLLRYLPGTVFGNSLLRYFFKKGLIAAVITSFASSIIAS